MQNVTGLNRRHLLIALALAIGAIVIGILIGLFGDLFGNLLDLTTGRYLNYVYGLLTRNFGLSFSAPHGKFLVAAVGLVPIIMIAVAGFYFLISLFPSSEKDDFSDEYEEQLAALEEVRSNLSSSLDFVSQLNSVVQSQQQKYVELKKTVDLLEEASKESAEGLRKKLEAIALVNRKKEFRALLIAFIMGFLASLLASAAWQFMSPK